LSQGGGGENHQQQGEEECQDKVLHRGLLQMCLVVDGMIPVRNFSRRRAIVKGKEGLLRKTELSHGCMYCTLFDSICHELRTLQIPTG